MQRPHNYNMVRTTGFEPVTPRLGIWCSILLSYGRIFILYPLTKIIITCLEFCIIQIRATSGQHMWFNIAASRDGVGASRDILAREMTYVDISKAQKLACEYAKKKYKRR